MKISVIVIAHNEEKHIAACLTAVLNQTQKADEVVLIAHNCTDKTAEVAKYFEVTIIPYAGPDGITHARIEGLRHVTGDVILCTDGDSYPATNWIEVMIATLQNGNVLVGSWVKYMPQKENWFLRFSNIWNRFSCSDTRKVARWVWGASMAFWAKDKALVASIWEKSSILSAKLSLSRNPDDYWLALFMSRTGPLEVTNRTHVATDASEASVESARKRSRENLQNGNAMTAFFRKYEGTA